jgi:hypothetical protein
MSWLWLRITRTEALFSLVLILTPLVWIALTNLYERHDYRDLIPLILSAILWLPYLLVLWNLRLAARSDPETVKKGLALGISWGFFIFALATYPISDRSAWQDPDWAIAALFCAISMLQITLVITAIKAYYSMQRNSDDWHILAMRLWLPAIGISLCVIFLPHLFRPARAANEASSIASLRTINTAQTIYAQDHPTEGFAASLKMLGPPPGAALIDAVLASGTKSGYIITLIATPPGQDGRVTKYTVAARPQRFERGETRSFFTDQSGNFHYTTEDRAPTAQDTPFP